jgi:hypothetical protein
MNLQDLMTQQNIIISFTSEQLNDFYIKEAISWTLAIETIKRITSWETKKYHQGIPSITRYASALY